MSQFINSFTHLFIHSSIHLLFYTSTHLFTLQSICIHPFRRRFIHSSSYLWNGFSVSDTGGQQYWFLYPVVPDTKRVPGDRPAAAIAVEADRPADPSHAHLRAKVNKVNVLLMCTNLQKAAVFALISWYESRCSNKNTQIHLPRSCSGFWRGACGEDGLSGDGGTTATQQVEQHCRRHG